jgi:glycosyltransferase involved in cell wall biosynthesis
LWLSPYDYHIDKDVVCSISKTGDLDVQLVLIWYNSEKKQLGSTVVRPGVRTEIRIPESTALMRFAFRIQGSGHGSIRAIRFSTASQEGHNSWIAKSNQLLVTGQYPSYTDLYRNAFVHRRIAGYKSKGLAVDLLRINPYLKEGFEEFQGIDVVMGSCYTLESALASDSYDSILVHFMTENIWNVLKNYIGRVKVYIWIHGAEIQPWWRREFNTSSQDERDKAVADSLLRQALWNEIFASDQANLHYVFVSKYFANEVAQDYSLDLEKLNYSVIHNFIDTDLFNNPPKTVEKRKRILSIRPFASRKYANDLTAKTILALSNKPFFKELEFRIIGDGQLFEETMAPLRIFENVILEKRFITQENIVSIQREFGLFLTPTRMDSQGVSRDEAMSSGLVPLTNNVAAIPEFVDETCAILAPEEDYIALANGIEYLYEHPEVFLKMSKAAAARVRKQTSFEYTIAKEIALILREPIKN